MAAWRSAAALGLVALLAACAAPPGPPPSSTSTPPSATPAEPAPADEDAQARFERRQREKAVADFRAGRLADAALAWEVLTVLRPDVAEYRERLATLKQSIGQATKQRMAAAQAARQRNDLPSAERAYLETLALDPLHAEAANALRALEAERSRGKAPARSYSAVYAAPAKPAKAVAAPPRGAVSKAAQKDAKKAAQIASQKAAQTPAAAPAPQLNHREHAIMLVQQGELDAAITLMTDALGQSPRQSARSADDRRLLARFFVQRADLRMDKDLKGARDDLKTALALDPQLQAAKVRLLGLAQKSAR